MRYLRAFYALTALALLIALWPGRGSARQASPITWEIAVGYDGTIKAGTWFPVTITVANAGPDIQGTIAMRFRNGDGSSFSQALDLPHNANKRVVLPVLADSNDNGNTQAIVTLTSGGAALKSENVETNVVTNLDLVIGVVSDEGNVLPELSSVQQPEGNRFGNSLVRLAPAALPERAELLQSFDVLFVQATDPALWSDAQRDALRIWISEGGQLVAGGDPRVLRGLGDLVPATAPDAAASGNIQSLSQTGWRLRAAAPTELPLLQLTPAAGAEVLNSNSAGQPLLVRRVYGAGTVMVTAFGLEALRDLGDPADLWERLLRLNSQQTAAAQLRDQGFFALEQSLQLPSLQIPSILGFLGFLLLYIVIVGPLNYLVLRRFDRREWAYVTIPVLVVLFSGAAYVWGTVGRGSSAVLSELTIVRALDDSGRGQATSFMALFSPTRHDYAVGLPADALAADLQPAWSRQGRALDVLFAEDATQVPSMLVDVGAVRALGIERSVPAPQIAATVSADGKQLRVRNQSDQTFDQLLIGTDDGRAQQIPQLAPGAEQTIALVFDRFVQDGFTDDGAGVISRSSVLSQLNSVLFHNGIDPSQFGVNGAIAPAIVPAPVPAGAMAPEITVLQPNGSQRLVLLGWQSTAGTPVTLDGRQSSGSGETLYIWNVRKEL